MTSYISVNANYPSYPIIGITTVVFLAPGYTTTSISSDFSVINSSQISYNGATNKKMHIRVRMKQDSSTAAWNPALNLVVNANPSDITTGSLMYPVIIDNPSSNSLNGAFDFEGYLDIIAIPGDVYIILLLRVQGTGSAFSNNFGVYIDFLSFT
jgi:hypothetical protein